MTEQEKLDVSLEIRRRLPVSPAKVFAAWTQAETMTRWFCPNELMVPEATVDPCVGGRYRIAMRHPEGAEYIVSGEYTRIEEPNVLEFTWRWESTSEDEETSLVRVDLREVPTGTELVLTHTRFLTPESRDSHQLGWDKCLDRLEKLYLIA